ncbi:capsular associated protein [Glarea lozoyensis ATCC 20868]|uniref:Capsular associated protein n=1 Tax=Glarea lozoyensis (strain ATCC 20868 / MF5171) TaxID=1116229 RepID=S3CWT6_GLAL2|nr:capsular associated protein [Glarea lozoyensis ATCC 20868]EPE30120.1 capsular associated protein [Glarea lozoyensis ATCC 20868]
MSRIGLQGVVLWNLVLTTTWIALGFEGSAAVERPVHLGVLVLGACGGFWWVRGRVRNDAVDGHAKDQDVANGLLKDREEEVEEPGTGRFERGGRGWLRGLRAVRYRLRNFRWGNLLPGALVVAVDLRILLSRSIVQHVECSWDGVKIFLPLLLSLLELLRTGTTPRSRFSSSSSRSHPFRYVFLVALWALSAYGTISMSAQRSTYICPRRDPWTSATPVFQCLELLIDAGIITGVAKLVQDAGSLRKSSKALSRSALASCSILGILTTAFLWKYPENMDWSLDLSHKVIFDLIFAAMLCTNFIGSVAYLMAELRPTTIFSIASFVSLYVYNFSIKNQIAIFPTSTQRYLMNMGMIGFVSIIGVVHMESSASRSQQHLALNRNSLRTVIVLCIFMLIATALSVVNLALYPGNIWQKHPVEVLMANARASSDQWISQASSSKSLKEAVVEYEARYGIPPPPNFDKWYEFATAKGSLIIDDFNQIHNDLLPFWGIKPSQIRQMTSHVVERPWTELAGLRISNGTALIGPHVPGTHRWMLDGTSGMINVFAKWLPDMDLAFNINDECRVAIPCGGMQDHQKAAKLAREQFDKSRLLKTFTTNEWSNRFMATDPPFPPDMPSEHFIQASFKSAFEDYSIISCLPQSSARTVTHWNKKSIHAPSVNPHTYGPFLSNWTLSASPCHQPSLAHLHGFHLSPSAFKPTTSLFPVFSQSKMQSFSDILFPSPWNYMDKVSHDPATDIAFNEKNNTLFWRGATSEGYAIHSSWRGMVRQRFVHLVTSITNSTAIQLLLPSTHGFSPFNIPFSSIVTKMNVSFVNEPTRCHHPDCVSQSINLPFDKPVDFQNHWQYRYLFDTDGAGFSGRFLPFLRSNSVVIRSAGFRQWFEERVEPWRHYVPVDGGLDGLWGVLGWFGGVRGGEGTEGGFVGEKDGGKQIAEEGKEWGGKVLRKVDMEVYMFRLLLEWGRIVDDERGRLGFAL